MSATPFLVLNRGNRRVIHQCESLAEAKGYSDGHSSPTSIAMLAESSRSIEWDFVIQTVSEGGKVIAQSAVMQLPDAMDTLCGCKLMLVPVDLAEREAVQS